MLGGRAFSIGQLRADLGKFVFSLDGSDGGSCPLEYSIGRVTCTVANVMSAVMVGLPGAAQDQIGRAHV